jgi:ABC-type histidine transport system ATPase subunit
VHVLGVSKAEAREQAHALLARVGLADKASGSSRWKPTLIIPGHGAAFAPTGRVR